MTHGTLPEVFVSIEAPRRRRVLTTIDNLILHHFVACLGSFCLVNPGRLVPVVVGDETKLDISIGQVRDSPWIHEQDIKALNKGHALFELVCKGFLVEEHIWIVILPVEPVLHLLHANYDAFQV